MIDDADVDDINTRLLEASAEADDAPPSGSPKDLGKPNVEAPAHSNGKALARISSSPTKSNGEILDKALPHDVDAERMVLRAIMCDPAVLDANNLTTAHFHHDYNVKIFTAIATVRENAQPLDIAHVAKQLKADDTLDAIGGVGTLGDLLAGERMPTITADYLRTLQDYYAKREMYFSATRLLSDVFTERKAGEILADSRKRIDSISESVNAKPLFNKITAAQLATLDFDINFYIRGAMVVGQPQGLFGEKKTLKTSIAVDQAISLSSGLPWLGYFQIERKARVAFFSAESGMGTIKETALRICYAAGVDLADTGIAFYETVPQLSDAAAMIEFERILLDDGIEVAYIDPMYLAMQTDGNEGSLFAMGALLRRVGELCQRVRCTPIILHHMKKLRTDPFSPGELDDIAWSGFAEFCRGWTFLTRREKYEPGSGLHKLWLSLGGSAGHSGLWGLDIAEGVYDGQTPRTWDVAVLKPSEVRDELADAQAEAKAAKLDTKIDTAKRALVNALAKFPEGQTEKVIKDHAGVSGTLAKAAFAALLQAGDIVPCDILKPNRKTPYEGYKLCAE